MTAEKPNIVLVTIDSLRADHCGYLGDERGLTPTLDSLAEGGVAFENAIAPGPQTFSSVPVSFTGRHRPPGDVEEFPGNTRWERRLAAIDAHLEWYAPIQERLQSRGYTTVGISPNPWTSAASGFDRGFDCFSDLSDTDPEGRVTALADRIPGVDTDAKTVQFGLNLLTSTSFFAQWENFYDELQRACSDLPEPYFLWVFLLDTHFPFITSRTHREEQSLLGMYYSTYRSEKAMRGIDQDLPDRTRDSIERSYRDAVRASDAFLSRLREDLAGDAPVFIVHSDHGESFGDHGYFGHDHRQVFEENIHVPFVIHGTGVSDTVSDPVSLTSLHDLTLTLASGGQFDPAAFTDEQVVASSEGGSHRAVRGRRYKLVDADERRLYDLKRDPDERTDVSGNHPDRLDAFRQQLERFECHREETVKLRRVAREHVRQGLL